MKDKRTVFFIMVTHPLNGPIRVGPPYQSKEVAHSWVRFVKASWRGCRTRVCKYDILVGDDGQPTPDAQAELDTRFNCTVTLPEREAVNQ